MPDLAAIAPSILSVIAGAGSALISGSVWRLSRRKAQADQQGVEERIDALAEWMRTRANPGDTIVLQVPGRPGEVVTLSNASGTTRDAAVLRELIVARDLELSEIPVVETNDN